MHADLLQFLSRYRPGGEERALWAGGTMPLRVRYYLCDALPPLAYVSSVRSLVRRGDRVLVCRNRDGFHLLPGGRRESGETLRQTLDRELLEETGWRIIPRRLLGLIHYEHLAPKPPDYPHPHPHFIMLIYLSDADALLPGARLDGDSELESSFMLPSRISRSEIEPASWFFLNAAREVQA